MPSSRRSCPIRLSTVAASETSSALVGSSQSRTSGGTTVARARAARWRWPPESCAGLAVGHLGGQADRGSGASRTRCVRSGPCVMGLRTQPFADQLADGQPRGERGARRPGRPSGVARRDRTRCRPASIGCSPAMERSSVDFPHPLSPTSATASPLASLEVHAAQGVEALAVEGRCRRRSSCETPCTSTAGGGPPGRRGSTSGQRSAADSDTPVRPASSHRRQATCRVAPAVGTDPDDESDTVTSTSSGSAASQSSA